LNWTVNTSSITWGTWAFTPESGENLTPDEGQVMVHVSVVAPYEGNSKFDRYLRIENRDNSTDFDLIPVYQKTPCQYVYNSDDGSSVFYEMDSSVIREDTSYFSAILFYHVPLFASVV